VNPWGQVVPSFSDKMKQVPAPYYSYANQRKEVADIDFFKRKDIVFKP